MDRRLQILKIRVAKSKTAEAFTWDVRFNIEIIFYVTLKCRGFTKRNKNKSCLRDFRIDEFPLADRFALGQVSFWKRKFSNSVAFLVHLITSTAIERLYYVSANMCVCVIRHLSILGLVIILIVECRFLFCKHRLTQDCSETENDWLQLYKSWRVRVSRRVV